MTEYNPYLWFYAGGEEAEAWWGPCDTRDEAIERGRETYGPDAFAICEANRSMVTAAFNEDFYAESIIEELVEKNEECWGEDEQGMDGHGPVDDLARRLRGAVAGWLLAHPWKGWCFGDVRTEERIPPDYAALIGEAEIVRAEAEE